MGPLNIPRTKASENIKTHKRCMASDGSEGSAFVFYRALASTHLPSSDPQSYPFDLWATEWGSTFNLHFAKSAHVRSSSAMGLASLSLRYLASAGISVALDLRASATGTHLVKCAAPPPLPLLLSFSLVIHWFGPFMSHRPPFLLCPFDSFCANDGLFSANYSSLLYCINRSCAQCDLAQIDK